jgi:hypothetical protein
VEPEAYAASRRRLGTLISQRAVEDDWITWLRARQGRLGGFGEQGLRKALDADIQMRTQQRRRLISLVLQPEIVIFMVARRLVVGTGGRRGLVSARHADQRNQWPTPPTDAAASAATGAGARCCRSTRSARTAKGGGHGRALRTPVVGCHLSAG